MARLCERPGCAAPATVAYGFDARSRRAWLQPFAPGDDGGALCRRHADAMVVPRGWALDDRRAERPLVEHVPADPEVADDPTGDWSPVGVARTELSEIVDATTPLLARAFGQLRPLPPPGTSAV